MVLCCLLLIDLHCFNDKTDVDVGKIDVVYLCMELIKFSIIMALCPLINSGLHIYTMNDG